MLARLTHVKLKKLKTIKVNFFASDNIFEYLSTGLSNRNSMKAMKKFFAAVLILVVAAIAFSSCAKKTCPAYSQVVKTPTEVARG